ncbi:leucyl/phenylalanyl-tRNA--protein transferase [Xanthobacter sp. TB0139]|uniref:leucyl/phenylalanyl-tRNA--protein transferase n=1 Tax=Xanthobacter sp. TB0139 TaxID=3459178 RepID=UPI004039239E
MSRMSDENHGITPDVLLKAYACGIFPMAESADDPGLFWIEPEQRGIIPLDRFRVPSRLARTVRSDKFEIRVDSDFEGVISGCAAPQEGRENTWINDVIRQLYGELFRRGHCHTVEAWRDGKLVGGLYGVRLGGAFFGESMFHRERDASKVALVHLVGRLIAGGFRLLDTQFVTSHLSGFGADEVPRQRYQHMLETALACDANFYCWPPAGPAITGAGALQPISHTS